MRFIFTNAMLLVLMSNDSSGSATSSALRSSPRLHSLDVEGGTSIVSPSPIELRAARLRILGQIRGYHLSISDVPGFVQQYNALVVAGKIEPRNGLRGIKDAYDLTLYTVLCEISTNSVEHVDLNKCTTIAPDSLNFGKAVDDIVYMLNRASLSELPGMEGFKYRFLDALASHEKLEDKQQHLHQLFDGLSEDKSKEFLHLNGNIEKLTDSVLEIDRIASQVDHWGERELDENLAKCDTVEGDHDILKLAKRRCRDAVSERYTQLDLDHLIESAKIMSPIESIRSILDDPNGKATARSTDSVAVAQKRAEYHDALEARINELVVQRRPTFGRPPTDNELVLSDIQRRVAATNDVDALTDLLDRIGFAVPTDTNGRAGVIASIQHKLSSIHPPSPAAATGSPHGGTGGDAPPPAVTPDSIIERLEAQDALMVDGVSAQKLADIETAVTEIVVPDGSQFDAARKLRTDLIAKSNVGKNVMRDLEALEARLRTGESVTVEQIQRVDEDRRLPFTNNKMGRLLNVVISIDQIQGISRRIGVADPSALRGELERVGDHGDVFVIELKAQVLRDIEAHASSQSGGQVNENLVRLEARVGSGAIRRMPVKDLETLREQVEGIPVDGNADFETRQDALLIAIDTKLYPKLKQSSEDNLTSITHDSGYNFKTVVDVAFVHDRLNQATVYYNDNGHHVPTVEEVRTAFNLCFGAGKGPNDHVIETGYKKVLMTLLKSAKKYATDSEGMPAVGHDLSTDETCALLRTLNQVSLVSDITTSCHE